MMSWLLIGSAKSWRERFTKLETKLRGYTLPVEDTRTVLQRTCSPRRAAMSRRNVLMVTLFPRAAQSGHADGKKIRILSCLLRRRSNKRCERP